MTPDKEQLCAQAYALRGDERVAFINANGITHLEFWEYAKAKKKARHTKRSTKTQRKTATSVQGGVCALCEAELREADTRRIDRSTGKVLHVGCQLYVGRTRKMIADGITLDRLADYLQIIPPKPPLDVFGPDAPDVDV